MKAYLATAIILVCINLTGCAVNQKINYHQGGVPVNITGEIAPFALSVEDARPYVLNNDKSPAFVGLLRSLYGIPYPVTTKSGNPLATDLATFMQTSLNDKGYTVSDVAKKYRIHLVLKEWKTDVYSKGTLFYAVQPILKVEGKEDMTLDMAEGRLPFGTPDYKFPNAISDAITDIFDDPQIAKTFTF